MKIGVSGAHSTGKTTFTRKLKETLEKRGYTVKIVSDLANRCPLPILRDHTVESTLWIACQGICEEIRSENEAEVLVVDRSIIDCWAYFSAVCEGRYSEDNPKLKTLIATIENWLPTYDSIYQTVIDEETPIEDTKGRDLDPEYRRQIGLEMEKACELFGAKPILLHRLKVDEEINHILNIVRNSSLTFNKP